MNATAESAAPVAPAAANAETVKMKDGRSVVFAGKRKMLKESIFPENDQPQVRFDFRNGDTINFRIPEGLMAKFAAHGAEQKLGDETAGETDVDDMQLAVESLIERLNRGEWSQRREGGGMSGTSTLLRALVEASGKSVEQIKAFLKDKSHNEKLALRNAPKIKPIVERIEAEKASKADGVDTDALLSQLDSAA